MTDEAQPDGVGNSQPDPGVSLKKTRSGKKTGSWQNLFVAAAEKHAGPGCAA